MVHLDYRDSRPIYTQIADTIREQILSGILQPGDRVPGVGELAASLIVNPNTIRQAYRHLEVEGWITTLPGKGSFVCGNGQGQEEQLERWFAALDQAAQALLKLGVTREQLLSRLEEGGHTDA